MTNLEPIKKFDLTGLPDRSKHHQELTPGEISVICKKLGWKRNHIPESYWERQWFLIRKYGEDFKQESLKKHLDFLIKNTVIQ